MDNNVKIDIESSVVKTHISTIQSIVNRMAANSTSCKTWCITLVSAILVLTVNKNKPYLSLIALLPTIFFFLLDTYYLTLEKSFIGNYNKLLKEILENTLDIDALFQTNSDNLLLPDYFNSIRSHAIYPFYFCLLIMILLTSFFCNNGASP